MIKLDGVKIPSLDAKDIYIANYLYPNQGYNLKRKDGSYNITKFKNALDYSLDLIKLREVYLKEYRNKRFSWYEKNEMEYTDRVINVTFKYSNKEYNKIGSIKENEEEKKKGKSKYPKFLYVKFGYEITQNSVTNCVYVANGELIAIQTGIYVPPDKVVPERLLKDNFIYEDGVYKIKKNKTLNSVANLRYELYKNGFWCNGIHYVRFKRSSGSSRVGKCLFIDEKLYGKMHKWEMCGIKLKEGDPVDLAALEAYIALTLSSIIDTIEIKPENILIVDDYKSVFTDTVIATEMQEEKKGKYSLRTGEKTVKISNSIWDGLSLIDKSIMSIYDQYGMILLRKNFFKSCCFNTNIQQFFKDNKITDIKQLNGFTLAEDIEDIKLITTPSSIKYLKFGTIEQWLKNIDSTFGVVKHEKKTHFFDGKMVQSHYQLINTLQLTKKQVREFIQPSLQYVDLLKSEPAAVRHYMKYSDEHEFESNNLKTKNEIIYQLMGLNDKFPETKWYKELVKDLTKSYKMNLKSGHVLIEGNYSTLLGNPYELLLNTIGKFNGESILGVGNVHTTRFPYGKKILGSRSPHVCVSNILLSNNVDCELIDKYFNLTDEIICINSIGENILERLNGADWIKSKSALRSNL